jgi:excinuclease ABC subunit C
VDGNNDFASLQEVLERRLQRGLNERAEHRESADFGVFPDLLIVDGGKGQLSAVCETLSDLGLSKIKVIALAEKEEEIYFPGQAKPLKIDQGRPALQLLQRIRDEAHRFALNYHRNLRAKSQINSELLQIAGVGPKRSQILLQTFGSLEQVKKASLDQLLHTPGLNKKTAYTVWRHWHKDDIINEE